MKDTVNRVYEKEIRREWDAINGTFQSIQDICDNKIVIERIETIIKHAKILGNYETALKRGVSI